MGLSPTIKPRKLTLKTYSSINGIKIQRDIIAFIKATTLLDDFIAFSKIFSSGNLTHGKLKIKFDKKIYEILNKQPINARIRVLDKLLMEYLILEKKYCLLIIINTKNNKA